MAESIERLIMSCQKIAGIFTFIVMMTPHIAERLLKLNTHNRKPTPAAIKKYQNEMENDEWVLTAQGIGIDSNGVLVDGQHRLMAIVNSKKTVPIMLVTGLPPLSQEKTDRGNKRSLAAIFILAGVAENKKQVQIAYALGTYINKYASDIDIKTVLSEHKESINKVIEAIRDKDGKGFGRMGFLVSCINYYEMYGDVAIEFIKRVVTGAMLKIDDPEMRLRRYLRGEGGYIKMGTSVKAGGNSQFCLDMKKTNYAINAVIMNKKITALKEAICIIDK